MLHSHYHHIHFLPIDSKKYEFVNYDKQESFPFSFCIILEQACNLAENFNSLVDTISSDSDWLLRTLRLTAENDLFTGKLVEIFKQVNAEGVKQQLRLGIGIFYSAMSSYFVEG